ncbi:unnamed protein product, partial [marine sediment metagenome]
TSEKILDLAKIKPILYLGSEDFYATTDKDSLQLIKRGI